MTPKDDRIRLTNLEMARGREVAAKNARQDTLGRWIKAGKIQVFHDRSSAQVRAYVADNMLVARCDEDRYYPTEQFVAQIGLAIKALHPTGFAGVAPANPPPRPKSVSALHVAETQRRLQELRGDL